MSVGSAIVLMIILWTGQAGAPAYVAAGDRVEQQFREYRDRLDLFYADLRNIVAAENPALLPNLQDRPPEPAVYGYQMLPTIVPDAPIPDRPVSSFVYSWPVTRGYIDGERTKLSRAEERLRRVSAAPVQERPSLLSSLVQEYRTLVQDQRVVDQYLQYNRLWQERIAEDRDRFDQMTVVYNRVRSGQPLDAEAIREALGNPAVPRFIDVRRTADQVVLRLKLYTDIQDEDFLENAKKIIEEMWQADEDSIHYSVQVDLRRIKAPGVSAGDHIDLPAHTAKFSKDGAVLTTGAQSTHSVPGRYIALGPGDLSPRTLAHEFGHVLGFRDGYLRGYRDIGEQGFEILELTSSFDDIMSAPRQGRVQPGHFKLLLEELKK